jgi:hypothetical protein
MPADFLDTPHWRSEKETLATSLADDEWKVVNLAFARLTYAHLTLTVEVPQWSSMDERNVAELTEFLQGAIERAKAAEKILENAQPLKN